MYEEWMEQPDIASEETPVYLTYKDKVFRMLYKNKNRLLELYNALNGSAYTNADDLTINTLENAIFMKMKNDVSFMIDSQMYLFEHQSSFCPNMALRGFLYFADLYKKHVKDIELSSNRKVLIPTPHYIVFYNGLEKTAEEFTQRLSDSFEDDSKGCIELSVRIININHGHNQELMNKCKTLSDYAYFVAEIRENLKTMELNEAVRKAVDTCIQKDILKDFLSEQKAEVITMSIYEYNEEYAKKALFEDGYDMGVTDGAAKNLIKNIESAMQNFHIDLSRACEGLGVTVEEYEAARQRVN
jgi:hypothetical protein